jgi:hypothetical protein
MANAQANLVTLGYITEVTPGTTPVAAVTYLRNKSSDFNANIDTETSQEITALGAEADMIRTKGSSTGTVNFELSAVEYEPFFESALRGAFSTAISMNVATISVSSTDNSYNDSASGFSTTNIKPGHYLRFGGFTNAANNGIARVVSVTTGKIVVTGLTLVTEAAASGRTVKGKSVRNGTTKKTFTLERKFSDLTNVFMVHKGMIVNQMTLNTSAGAIVEGSFGFMGRGTTIPTATSGNGSFTASTTNSIISATANVGTVYENNTAVSGIYFKSINLTTNSNTRELDAIGNLYPIDVNVGTFTAEFAMEAYFSDTTLLTKFLNGTATELSYSFTDDAGNSIVIDAPQVKYSAATLGGVNLNSDVMQSLTGRALYDATYGYALQISYIPA